MFVIHIKYALPIGLLAICFPSLFWMNILLGARILNEGLHISNTMLTSGQTAIHVLVNVLLIDTFIVMTDVNFWLFFYVWKLNPRLRMKSEVTLMLNATCRSRVKKVTYFL